jgi:hypothetical protein
MASVPRSRAVRQAAVSKPSERSGQSHSGLRTAKNWDSPQRTGDQLCRAGVEQESDALWGGRFKVDESIVKNCAVDEDRRASGNVVQRHHSRFLDIEFWVAIDGLGIGGGQANQRQA